MNPFYHALFLHFLIIAWLHVGTGIYLSTCLIVYTYMHFDLTILYILCADSLLECVHTSLYIFISFPSTANSTGMKQIRTREHAVRTCH